MSASWASAVQSIAASASVPVLAVGDGPRRRKPEIARLADPEAARERDDEGHPRRRCRQGARGSDGEAPGAPPERLLDAGPADRRHDDRDGHEAGANGRLQRGRRAPPPAGRGSASATGTASS